jgi:hypothetical protein
MAVKLRFEDYALMARYLRGEASAEDTAFFNELVESDPSMREHYEVLKVAFLKPVTDTSLNDFANDNYLQQKFNQITRKLKDEGSLQTP